MNNGIKYLDQHLVQYHDDYCEKANCHVTLKVTALDLNQSDKRYSTIFSFICSEQRNCGAILKQGKSQLPVLLKKLQPTLPGPDIEITDGRTGKTLFDSGASATFDPANILWGADKCFLLNQFSFTFHYQTPRLNRISSLMKRVLSQHENQDILFNISNNPARYKATTSKNR